MAKEVFHDIEDRDSYFVQGVKGPMEALITLEIEWPQLKGVFKHKDVREMFMSKCLDCESWWVSDDVCGECGEMRLSKRLKRSWYISKKD